MRVLIVDDHLLFAEAIRLTLTRMGISVVAIVTTAREAVPAVHEHEPDLVLVDIGLPDQSGVDLGRSILEERPNTKVVALTALEEPRMVRETLQAGFHGYLTKNSEAAQFARALESVLDGQFVFPQRLGKSAVRTRMPEGSDDLLGMQLTARELEVLQLLTEGASSWEMAERLSVSPNTVRTHVQGILSKLQVHSRLEAAAFAVRHNMVTVRS